MDKNEILKEVLTEILPIVKKRIFGNGLAANMTKIGRSRKTRQFVDLVNTGALRNDVQVMQVNGKYGIGVSLDISVEKIKENEKRFAKVIFALTKDEKELVKKLMYEKIKKALTL